MQKLPSLKPGDYVEIIAPASRCTKEQLTILKTTLESWQLNCLLPDDIVGDDILCANTDEARFKHLQHALQNPQTNAILCARGGYGSMRLIPQLAKLPIPRSSKIFVGMSDTIALQLYLQQQWHWPTIHGVLAPGKFSDESIAALESMLFGKTTEIKFTKLLPLNQSAKINHVIESSIIGGNLAIIQSGVGTIWQLDARNKIVLLEEINEQAYRIDRMLEHLSQANIFKEAAAILIADFIGEKTSLIQSVINRFAENCTIPVVQVAGVGHGHINFPVPLGILTKLQLGHEITLTCFR